MIFNAFSLLASAALASAAAVNMPRAASVSITPHDRYSSSIGVLGCKINTDRVAYWPMSPSCNDICVKVSANGRSVYLLRIDQSGGAHDISYDAWNYLYVGKSATESPQYGGGIPATWEGVPMSNANCKALLKGTGGRLAFSAANSMNFITSCSSATWVGQHNVLYNILNPVCTWGYDEICTLPPPNVSNEPTCPHQLGVPVALTTQPVYNIDYGTGKKSLAV
ncbi:uncharacterized protein E0L32_007402 [Thyridium curvatum]|uniref:Cerato-platanin n=1 Tax=Thyridium curvatum TaxID=1093900 RepID=A0A507AZN1_9PEZI|nr:uncharacterized protein E0L32_007402 [Thyridium curvatum]TPX11904.1 hypothetical protein E0L32_007402 [Thyridium curvatum]